jgi:lysophospholipase L1-like esterase
MCVSFKTDSTSISAKWRLGFAQLGEDSFNICSFSGVDLYCRNETSGSWQWAGAPGHKQIADQNPSVTLRSDLPEKMREWRLYFPQRNWLQTLAIGVDESSSFTLAPPRSSKGFVYYGSSIVHGAYAGRAGTGAPNLLARRLELPLINLGFSGAARMETDMSKLLAELDPEFFLIDPLPNMTPELVSQNAEAFIEFLCAAKRDTDVFMVSDAPIAYSWLYPKMQDEYRLKNKGYFDIFQRLKIRHPKLHYIDGQEFLGSDFEGTIDGVHPNDCGCMRMADILESNIRRELGLIAKGQQHFVPSPQGVATP